MRASKHWYYQRVSAFVILLFVPAIWWLCLALNTKTYASLVILAKSPVVIILSSLLLGIMLYHAKLGIDIIIEDYVLPIKRKMVQMYVNVFIGLFVILYGLSIFFLFKGD